MPKNDLNEKKFRLSKYKFLLDANLSRTLVSKLHKQFNIKVHHISEFLPSNASDKQIIGLARNKDFVIVTHDLDYGELYYLATPKSFGVIMLRLSDQTMNSVHERLSTFFSSKIAVIHDLSKSLLIISESKVRIIT